MCELNKLKKKNKYLQKGQTWRTKFVSHDRISVNSVAGATVEVNEISVVRSVVRSVVKSV